MRTCCERVEDRRGAERRAPGQELVEDASQRIDVGARADLLDLPLGLLGRHVAGRAQDRARLGLPGVVFEPLHQPEVADLGLAACGQEDVGRLQIAMDDAAAVGVFHAVGQRSHQPGRLARRLRRAVDLLGQAAAGDVFEREEGLAVVFADLVDLDDVGMLQLGHGHGLAAEPRQVGGAVMSPARDHLERDDSLQPALAGLVDDPHPPLAQHPQDLVSRDLAQPVRRLVLLQIRSRIARHPRRDLERDRVRAVDRCGTARVRDRPAQHFGRSGVGFTR